MGEINFGTALKTAWSALVYSLMNVMIIFAFATYLMHIKEKKRRLSKEDIPSINSEEPHEGEHKQETNNCKNGDKNVNIAINMG